MEIKLSIITIVYNREHDIEFTISSIVNQSFKNFEYIIIDGKSNDGTLDIISKYKDSIDVLVSEKDNGIYDAMNKGLNIAKGAYVLFINGGDRLFDNHVLTRVFEKANSEDIIYGDCLFFGEDGKAVGLRSEIYKRPLPESLKLDSFKYGSNISHQSFMVKKSITKSYDLSYKIAADIDWMLYAIKNSKNNLNTGLTISRYLIGGLSNERRMLSIWERCIIFYKYYGLKSLWYQLLIFGKIVRKIGF